MCDVIEELLYLFANIFGEWLTTKERLKIILIIVGVTTVAVLIVKVVLSLLKL